MFKCKSPKVGKESFFHSVKISNIYGSHKVETDSLHYEVLAREQQIPFRPNLEQKTGFHSELAITSNPN